MTAAGPDGKLVNISPYGTWRGSPMGLAGRDPIFFAQLASETETFHPSVGGRRSRTPASAATAFWASASSAIDSSADRHCEPFTRATVDAIPYPAERSGEPRWRITARSRATAFPAPPAITWCSARRTPRSIQNEPQNKCVAERQAAAQSRPDRLRHDLHRQLPRRPARQALRTVRGAQEEADEERHRHRAGASARPSRARNCAAAATPCICRSCTAARRSDTPTSRRPIRNGRSATTAPATTPDGPLPLRRRPAGAVLPGLPHAEQGRGGQSLSQQDRLDPGIQQLPAGRAHAAAGRTSTCRCAPASASTRWSGSTSSC